MFLINTKCPFCGDRFRLSDVKFVCQAHNDPQPSKGRILYYPKQPAGHYMEHPRRKIPSLLAGWLTKANISTDVQRKVELGLTIVAPKTCIPCSRAVQGGRTCGRMATLRVCPSCHAPITANAEEVRPFIIGMLGASQVGKSHFIATAIESLSRGLAAELGITMTPIADTEQQYNERYHKRVYEGRKALHPSDSLNPSNSQDGPNSVRIPLVYEIQFVQHGPTPRRHPVNLTLYDVAGMDCTDEKMLGKHGRHILKADAIILMVGFVSRTDLGGEKLDPHMARTLETLISLLANRSKADRPAIAVVVSKADLFKSKGLLDRWPQLTEAASHAAGFRMDVIERTSEMTRELLSSIPESRKIPELVETEFQSVRYFMVSSLGFAPVGSKLERIKPFRVEEPLLWLLDNMGVGILNRRSSY